VIKILLILDEMVIFEKLNMIEI